ncbi:MAG: hypothetical protein S4CHLAM102_11790 [Chlamydiia bacterium]|nr:hypothetical protein [Chlamydiia bacterium]
MGGNEAGDDRFFVDGRDFVEDFLEVVCADEFGAKGDKALIERGFGVVREVDGLEGIEDLVHVGVDFGRDGNGCFDEGVACGCMGFKDEAGFAEGHFADFSEDVGDDFLFVFEEFFFGEGEA